MTDLRARALEINRETMTRKLRAALTLTPNAYAGSLADDAMAGLIRKGLGDLSEATLTALGRIADRNGVVSGHVMRMAIRFERARRRAFSSIELERAS